MACRIAGVIYYAIWMNCDLLDKRISKKATIGFPIESSGIQLYAVDIAFNSWIGKLSIGICLTLNGDCMIVYPTFTTLSHRLYRS